MNECPECNRCFPDEISHCPNDGAATVRTLPDQPVLDGRYQLERRLGQGAMGVVYLARHIYLKSQHAIKIILPELVGNDPMLATRFRQEALAAASISHPNVIAVTDFGILRGTTPFLVMEYLRGPSLQDLMNTEGPMSVARTLEIIRPLVAGVAAAHHQGIIHRDLKPLNIMLQEGRVPSEGLRILDFGLAKIKSGELLGSFVQAQTSGLMGSPWYMAPEQWSDEEPNALADLYSIGTIVYQMLAGDVPFKGASIPSVMKKHLSDRPPDFTSFGVKVPAEIERVVVRALEKVPSNRQQSVEEFLHEFEQAASEDGVTARTTNTPLIESLPTTVSPPPLESETAALLVETTSDESGSTLSIVVEPPRRRSQLENQTLSPVVQGNLTLHMEKIEREISSAPENFSSTVLLRHSEIFRHTGEHIFEDLVLHKDYERLWRSFIHAGGGCNLLTGYGPFGGTSLVRCAIEKARGELSKRLDIEAALVVFYFSVVKENKNSFELEATKFGLEHLNKPKSDLNDPAFDELKERAEQSSTDTASLLNFNLQNPLGHTFFNPRSKLVQSEIKQQTYDFSNLTDDLNDYFREQKSSKVLHEIISRLVKSEFLPSRVLFIIDRIKHLETLEALSASDLFSNKRIRVIVVSRKEDFDCWHDVHNRLERINFSKWYVPCLWNIDFNKVLFRAALNEKPPPEFWQVFLKHLEFSCRGSLGNIIGELRNARNINFAEDGNYIDVASLIHRVDILHNAWLQELLEMNWDALLSDHFVGFDQDEKTDRARIGIYYLIDWLARKSRFTKEEIVTHANQTKITISDDEDIRLETVEALLYVLTTSRYLMKDSRYRVVWNRDNPPDVLKVPRKRTSDLREPVVAGPDAENPKSEESSVVKRWARNLVSFINSQLVPSPKAAPGNDNLAKNPIAPVVAEPTAQPAVKKEQTYAAPAPGILVKAVHKTIKQRTEYFIDKKDLDAEIQILIVFANPEGSDPLRLGEEDRLIRECLQRSRHRERFKEKIVHAARIKDVQRALVDHKYQIVHFSGHGVSTGQLAFEDETGQIKLVPQKALSDLLLQFPSIQCVILNACYSVSQGRMLSLGVPFTIAMNTAISDDASQHFSRGFYDALGAGNDYEFAYKMGCNAISLEGLTEESTPVLFKKPQ